jgi:molybdopterin molybdotransferase
MSDLHSVEEARDAVLAAVPPRTRTERREVTESVGLVLAEPIVGRTALPPWDNSAMDGYAIRAGDVAGATEESPAGLTVIGEVRAGIAPSTSVQPGTAIRIATGAPIPPGADAVVQVELTTPTDAAGTPSGPRGRDATGAPPAGILVHEVIAVGAAVRRRGSDLADGTTILEAGTAISAAGIALASGSGVSQVVVYPRPRVVVLATGDEIVTAGEPLGPAGIPDANGPGLAALVEAAGGEAIRSGIARDRLDDVLAHLTTALAGEPDAIIVSGGVSVGPYDVVRTAFERLGRIEMWKVAVQPGKPFVFGTASLGEGRPTTLLFGLPGNPVSSFVTFELFVRPAIRAMAGRPDVLRPTDRAALGDDVSKSAGRRAFVRVTAERDATGTPIRDDRGRVRVRLSGGAAGQGSHVLSALATADALAVIPEAHDTLAAGAEVELWWLDRA